MAFYSGSVKILYIDIDSSWIPVACLTSNTFEEETELISTTTRENNGWETFKATKQRATVSFDGLQTLTDGDSGDATKVSYDRLKILKREGAELSWKIEDTDTLWTETFNGYLVSLSESAPVDDWLSFSGQIRVTTVL